MLRRVKGIIVSLVELLRKQPVKATIKIVCPEEVLAGKVVLVTGGTSGIGKAIAQAMFQAGAFVVITSRSFERVSKVASELDATRSRVIGIEYDSTDIAAMPAFFEKLLSQVPNSKIDILVNNAGLVGGDIRSTSEKEFDDIINTNLKSVFFLSKLVAEHQIRNHLEGNILNVASSSSLRPAISAYALSKWGIRGLTEGLAKMYVPHKIVVNGIAPGPTATPMMGKEDYSDIALPSNPLGRYALPEEIAAMAVFLAGPQGRMIVGDIVYMTGGAGVVELNDMNYKFTL